MSPRVVPPRVFPARIPWRPFVALACCLGFIGCLSLSLEFGGKRSNSAGDPVLVQNGSATVHGDEPCTVYYPVAYHSPPNLEIESVWHFDREKVSVIRQERDHFCIVGRKPGSAGIEFRWTARGLPVTVALPPSPVVVVPAAMPVMPVPPAEIPPPSPTLPKPLPSPNP